MITFCAMRRQKGIKLIHKPPVLYEAMCAYCIYNMHVNMVIIASRHLLVQQQMLKSQQGKQKVLAEGAPRSLPSKESVGSVMTLSINTTLHITPVREKLI